MPIPSRQIGWSTQDNLLWQIAKQMEQAECQLCTLNDNIGTITGTSGTSGSSGQSGTSGTSGLSSFKYGSFYSTQDQSLAADAIGAMTFNNTDFSSGVSIVSSSRITVTNAGKYNIQFSAQFHHIGGGGSGDTVNIWLSKNGAPVPDSNTRVTITSSTKYVVSAWNFFANASAGDFYEITWSTNNTNIKMEYEPAGVHPAIPSVILTVNQIGI
jgi:hypothetical protein